MESLELDYSGMPGFAESETLLAVEATVVQEESNRSVVKELVLPTAGIIVAGAVYCYIHYRKNRTRPSETK